jgi:hypothetical protein
LSPSSLLFKNREINKYAYYTDIDAETEQNKIDSVRIVLHCGAFTQLLLQWKRNNTFPFKFGVAVLIAVII